MHLKKYMYKVWLFFIVLITVYSMPYAAHAAISGVATFNFTGNGRAATDCGDYLYMLTESPAKVIKLDKNTMTQVDETVGLAGGNGIAITNDGSYLYVLTYNGSSLSSSMSKVDMNTMGVVTTVDSLCSGEVWGITVYDNYLYLATKTSPAKVIKMDTTTMAVDKSGDLTAGNARAVTNDGNYMYVVTETSPTRVIKVNMGTMSQVGEPVELAGGKGMAVTRDDTHLYVVNYTSPSSSVTKVQMSDMQDGAVTLTGIPYAHVVTSDDIYLYVATFTDPVTVIKVNKSDITSSSTYTQNTVENIKSATAFTCDDKYLYMVTYSPGKVIKLPKNTAEASAASLTPEAGTDNTIALTVKDTLGNADTDFDGDKTVTVTGYEAAPDGTYGSFGGTALEADGSTDVTVSFADGVGTPSLALNKADEQTIGFSISGVNAPGASVTITPAAAPAASMELTQDITAPASNGGQFAQQPVITLKDTYGNTCAGDSSTQVTASEKESGNWILTGTVTKTASNGVVTFTGLGATNTAQVNNAQLAFNAAGLTEVVSVTVTLPAPAGAQTATALAAEATPAAGANNTITLTVKNALGNTDTGFDGARDVTISGVTAAPDGTYGSFNATALDTASAGAGQTISVDFANGQATADLALNDAGTQNLAFSIVGVATPSTNTLTITPTAGTAGSMSLTTDITAPATNGGQFAQQPVITLKDAYSNTCAGNNSTQVTASKNDAGNWALTGTDTVTADNGIVTFTDLGASNAARVDNAQLAFNATGLSQITSSPVLLSPPGLSITNNSLPHGTVGEYYSATLAASGGTAPYTWIITGLPAELSYSTVQGTVYGTPVSTGEYSVSAAVYDNYSQNAGKNFILSIDNSPAVRVTGIALNKNSLILTAGGANETLTYTITPANASNQSVTWHSSNPSVATAVYGVVTPKAAGTIGVTVTTTDGDFTDTCSVTVNAQSSGSGNHRDSGSGRNNSNNDHTSTPNNISINGRELQGLGRTVTTYENGQAVTTVTVDQQRIEQALESEGNNAVVTIFTNADSDKVIGELNGQTVKSMEQKQAVLNVSTGDASYTLSAAQINIDAVSEQIGQQVELKDIKVTVEISKTPNEVKIIENDAEQGGYTIVAPPVSFDITCTYGNKSIQVDKFNSYVERTIAIPEGVDPQKITTGVIVNPDGTLSHVPTQIVVIDGKYYAKINSLTNSTYSVIWNPVVFSDVTNHWAKEPVNEMGSRKVIGGIGDNKFAPDREITRAEFASITIRALGLVENDNKNTFKDVKESDWFSGAVSKTNEYGLISGYTDGTFRPHNKITREEAMAIISKTMNLVGIDTDTTDTETQLANFKDRDKIGGWAKDAVAACIKNNITKGSSKMLNPKDNITRAETAATVMRLLQEAELI